MEINNEPLSDRAVVFTTCPIARFSEYIISASSTGAQGNETVIQLYTFCCRSQSDPIKLITEVPTTMKFSSIAWTKYGEDTEQNPLGFVIGGHPDGSISLWSVTTLLSEANQKQKANYSRVFCQKLVKSQINVISCNFKPHLFAVGSHNISIMSIDKNLNVSIAVNCDVPAEGGEFCSLSWNPNDKVNHILASSTTSGYTYIYDMKKSELFLSICDQSLMTDESNPERQGPVHTCVTWNSEGAQVVISYDDPEYNYLTQYHMKQPKSPSAMYQNGHNTSIIDITKNTIDTNFLLSLGRDNIVTCWSMRSKKPLVRIQLKEKCSQVEWINKMPDCFICAGFDGKLYYDRINFAEDHTIFADGQEMVPKWMNKPCGMSFAFGGKLYEFNQSSRSSINLYKSNGNRTFVNNIKNFIEKIETNDLTEALDEKIKSVDNKTNLSLYWAALKSMYNKNLDGLFKQMGFDKAVYDKDIATALGRSTKEKKKNIEICQPQIDDTEEDLGKLFEKTSQQVKDDKKQEKAEVVQSEKPNTIQESFTRNINWNVGNEKLIKQSLQFGDLESAIELLFKNNRTSEALIIASHEPSLFKKATERYFNNNKDFFIKSIFPAIINNNFDLLFDYNVVKEWKEYLLYSKTYLGNSIEFESFADRLGDKLATNPDIYAALVCYILAEKYNKCADLLITNFQREAEKLAREEKKIALHNLFEQVISLTKILNSDLSLRNDNYMTIIYNYCELLIEEGLIMEASRYLINIRDNSNLKIVELYDRLYYHCEHELGKSFAKPANPYNIVVVKSRMTNQRQIKGDLNQNKRINNQNNVFDNTQVNPQQKKFTPNVRTVTSQNPQGFNPKGPFNAMPSQEQTPQPPLSQPPQQRMPPQFTQKPPSDYTQQSEPVQPYQKTVFKPMNPPINPPKVLQQPRSPITHEQTPPINKPNQPFAQPKMAPVPYKQPDRNITNQPTPSTNAFPSNPGNQKQSQIVNQEPTSSMTPDEETLHTFFVSMEETYNSVFPDENKQKDFKLKLNSLLNKFLNHEIKANLIQLLLEYKKLYEQGLDMPTFKKLYFKIQSNDWDKNKSWMPLLERLVNMKK